MANQGTVGANAQGGLGKGTAADERLDQSAALVVTDGHARYQEALYTGNCYLASNQAAQTITGLATTVTGFAITNPVASGKNLVIIDACFALGGAPAGATQLGWAYNTSATAVTHTTPETIRNAFLLGNGTQTPVGPGSVAKVDNSATTPTAGVFVRMINGSGTSAITTPIVADPIDGKIILSPGSYMHLAFLTTAYTTLLTSMTWEEVGLTSVK